MTLIGIDLGSHSASIAVWHDDKNMLEVLADDLGFRTIPCVVAFRGEETIVGHSAVSQRHKNAMNTFSEVRSLLFNYEQSHCSVPALEKDMTVEEINSIFFRNIHNQVKQQAGKVIRDAVITVPQPLDEATKKRYIEAAQHGGIRIKSFLEDSTAALLAYGFDEPNNHHASRVLVADLGWSRSTVSVYNISNGAFNLQGSKSSTDVCGKIFVKLLSDFCAKEFLKKNKVPVTDNKRAMMRLTHECELAIKALSTGTEATIDIDSLCEGIDYSSKISRARLEDLLSIPVIHFKNLVNNVLKDLSLTGNSINSICLSGGPSSMPKFINILKQLLPNATFPKVRFETSEAPAIGAAVHGKHLFELGLIDEAPTQLTKVKGLKKSIFISSNANGDDRFLIFNQQTPFPAHFELPIQLPANGLEGSFFIFMEGESAATDPIILLGEISFAISEVLATGESLLADFLLSEDISQGLKIQIKKVQANEVISSLDIPISA